MVEQHFFQNSLKTIGLFHVNERSADQINADAYKSYIKVLYLPEGYEVKVDFTQYKTTGPALFFLAPNQFLQIENCGPETGCFVFYNQDFYCIHLHDLEVACDGLLFNNVKNMPMVVLGNDDDVFVRYLLAQMETEFGLDDTSREEMIRTCLKQIFIKSARLWKRQHLDTERDTQDTDLDFFRKFTLLVDEHYKQKHSVADYADVLFIAPKTITHKLRRLNLPQPNEIIKNRIVLEAKRLLAHSSMTAKEIAFELGYEDPAYFSRIFVSKTGESPSAFRTKFLSPVA